MVAVIYFSKIEEEKKNFGANKRNQSRTNGPINAHLTIAQV